MNQEESIYGFIANTKAMQITTQDTTALQKYVGAGPVSALTEPTNINRIILKIVNQNYHEPIKANIIYNTVDKRIEIRVTYSLNGINKILDEYGNTMTLTEENGIIYTNTGSVGLAKGTYYFTVVDNKGNKKELSITPNVDSLFKVAYTNGTDNMTFNTAYTKSQETKTSTEITLLNQIKATDTSTTYDRAITDTNSAITAIAEQTRTSEDEQLYMYGKYKANAIKEYVASKSPNYVNEDDILKSSPRYFYKSYSINSYGSATFSGVTDTTGYGGGYSSESAVAYLYNSKNLAETYANIGHSKFYYWDCINHTAYSTIFRVYPMNISLETTGYSRGDFISNIIAKDGTYPRNDRSGSYWYVRNSLAKKYKLYKYDSNINLKSIYDIETKTITTEPIDISNKGNNKVKLTLITSGSNYKTYISSDNANWQEVTGVTYNTPKELDVDGWDNLYIKIETNTSRIDNIDVAYYKD